MEQYTPENLLAGSEPVYTTETKIASGQDLAKNTPLGQKTSTGEFHAWDPAATDGTENATRMTVGAVDTTGGVKTEQAYKTGNFNTAAVAWPGGATDAQKATAFVGTPISHQTMG